MNKPTFLLLVTLSAATFCPLRAADYTFGSFEGTTTGGGFGDWGGSATFSNSATGATVGTMSIRQEPGAFGYYQGLSVKIQDLPDNDEAFAGFAANTHVAVDVTFDPADFEYTGEGWNGGRILMYYNERGAGWQDDIGVDIADPNGFKVPNIDTGNPVNPGFWDLTSYPTVHTRTMMWDYSSYKAANNSTATDGWIEFFFGNNLGNFNTAAMYFDNWRFTTPPAGIPGDFDDDGNVDGRDFLEWQRGNSPSPLSDTDLQAWRTNFGEGAPLASFTAVPEPAAICLFAIGSMASLLVRKR